MDDLEYDELINEVDILKKLDHPNITNLYEFYDDEYYFALVTDLHSGGSVFD